MSAPDAVAPYAARENGPYLVVDKGAALPAVCVKCSRTDGLHQRSQTFQSFDAWIYFFFLIFGALAVALFLWVRPRRGTLELPICDRCDGRWRTGRAIWTASLLWLFMFSFCAYLFLLNGLAGLFLILEIAAILPAVLVRFTVARTDTVIAVEIDEEKLCLAGVHAAARKAIVAAAAEGK